MGYHFKAAGFSSPEEMFSTMNTTLQAQLDIFFRFVANSPDCLQALVDLDFEAFNVCYGGPSSHEIPLTINEEIETAAKAYAAVSAVACFVDGKHGTCKLESNCKGTMG